MKEDLAAASARAMGMLVDLSGPDVEERLPEVMADLVGQSLVDQALVDRVMPVLQRISEEKQLIEVMRGQIDEDYKLKRTLPVLRGMWTDWVTIAEFSPEYSKRTKVSDYHPRLKRVVKALHIQMDLNRFGDLDRVSFGLSPQEVQDLITRLQLALKQLEAFPKGDVVK